MRFTLLYGRNFMRLHELNLTFLPPTSAAKVIESVPSVSGFVRPMLCTTSTVHDFKGL